VPGAEALGDDLWRLGEPDLEGEITPPSFFADGAVVRPGARVEGSVLSTGAVVEEGSVVRESVLLDGARVAAGSTVTGSVLGPRSTVGERCELRPVSVLGESAVVPSGTLVEDGRIPG
jgi:ADP-glucose pyrophosphorylase